MPGKKQDDSQVISVRLPHALVRRLDRYLDWSEFYRRVKSSRNAAMRDALSTWLDHQEQLAGLIEPQAQRQQFQAAYQSVAKNHDWAAIPHLRQLLPWPRERFDAVLEALRADHHVELDSAAPDEMSDQALQESSHVHGQLYARVKWCGSSLTFSSPNASASMRDPMQGPLASGLQPHYNRRSQPRILGKRLIADAIGPV